MTKNGKRGRGPATASFKDCDYTIDFNQKGVPIGKNSSYFTTWLGVKLKAEFSYHIPRKDIEPHKWENLWEDIKVLYFFIEIY